MAVQWQYRMHIHFNFRERGYRVRWTLARKVSRVHFKGLIACLHVARKSEYPWVSQVTPSFRKFVRAWCWQKTAFDHIRKSILPIAKNMIASCTTWKFCRCTKLKEISFSYKYGACLPPFSGNLIFEMWEDYHNWFQDIAQKSCQNITFPKITRYKISL